MNTPKRYDWNVVEPDTVTADFPIIRMGLGEVEVGDAVHEGLPALWFGIGGRGLGAPEMQHNRPAHDGETLALFTFVDIRGLEAIEKACSRVRSKIIEQMQDTCIHDFMLHPIAGEGRVCKVCGFRSFKGD